MGSAGWDVTARGEKRNGRWICQKLISIRRRGGREDRKSHAFHTFFDGGCVIGGKNMGEQVGAEHGG